jgi:hypothetical protein
MTMATWPFQLSLPRQGERSGLGGVEQTSEYSPTDPDERTAVALWKLTPLAKQEEAYTPFFDICSTSFDAGSLYVPSTRSTSGKAML